MDTRKALGNACFVAACVLLIVLTRFIPELQPVDGSTVKLKSEESQGTGVVIGSHVILTAGHIADHGLSEENGGSIEDAFTVSSSYVHIKASTLWSNGQTDIGLLYAEEFKFPYQSPIACRDVVLGEPVTIIGYPNITKTYPSHGAVLTQGVVSSRLQKSDKIGWPEFVIVDALASYGNSGGAVFDSSRNVIGILVGIFGDDTQISEGDAPSTFINSGYSIMIPSSTFCKFLALPVKRGWL